MTRFLVALACAVLAIGTLPYFEHRWVENESWYAVPAVTLLRTGDLRNSALPAFDSESRVDTRPPLMPLSLAASFRLFGPRVAAARVGPLLAIAIALLTVYAIGRVLGDPLAGGIAALLLAADNVVVLAARTARPEAWVTLLGSAALFFVLRSRSWRHAAAAGLCVGASCLFEVLGLGWVAAIALVLLFQERGAILRSSRTYGYAAGVIILVVPFLVWLVASSERIEAARHMYGRDARANVSSVIVKEQMRFADYLGVPNERLSLPFRVPFRLHVVLAIGAAFVILWYRRRVLFWTLTLATLPHLIWLIRLPNANVRYLAIEGPLFALAVACAVTELS